ncbi:MAG: acetate--CoA ligase family protein [Dehalococcoidia bacterium]|nr:acetate--CoA ligase family protein [Dehalococcoidia bacterium]
MVQKIIGKALKEGRAILTETESKELISLAGINVVETYLASDREAAVEISRKVHYPVALKVVSPDIVHKSDIGGVKLNLKSGAQVRKAYDDIMAAVKVKTPRAKIWGVAVQKMALPGIEIIIGMSKDPQFGPVILFGLGGILVEVLKDYALRIVPLEKRDASEMIKEIKAYPVLEGFRGRDPGDVPFLEDMLLKVSKFVGENPEIKELDLNPVIVYKKGAVAVDARVVLENPVKIR